MTEADLIIIGAGPGGMEANRLAILRGLSPVVIEREEVGGTCLNRGCIPTKALCRSAEVADLISSASSFGISAAPINDIRSQYAAIAARKDAIVSSLRQGAETGFSRSQLIKGDAKFVDAHTVEVNGELFTAPKIIIATGSAPARLPVEGAELAMTSDDILRLTELPESLCIIGGGVIGMELACIMHSFGVKVTVVEYCPEILPNFDKEVGKRLRSLLSRKGMKLMVNAAVTGISEADGRFTVRYQSKGKEDSVVAGAVLMATGRRPVLPVGCEEVGIRTQRGAIEVDDNFSTSVPGVYAIGDVNGQMMLAHVASAQAAAVMGEKINLDVVPAAAFTSPEAAMVGFTEDYCKKLEYDFEVKKSLYRSNGKATAMGEVDGFAKLIIDRESGDILGCHIIGAHASDLVQEVATAMANGLKAKSLKNAIHAHPTLSEIISSFVE